MTSSKQDQPTKVKFYTEHGDTFAVFPTIKADLEGNMLCYAHIGQHSACSPEYLKEPFVKPANPQQYADLKKELESIGYNLQVIE